MSRDDSLRDLWTAVLAAVVGLAVLIWIGVEWIDWTWEAPR